VESHWLERQDGFARFVHRLNLFFEPARGADRAELAGGGYENWYSIRVSGCHPTNASDKCGRLHITDAGGVVVEKITAVADLNIVIALLVHTADTGTGLVAQGDVIAAVPEAEERFNTNGRVLVADVIVKKR